MMADKELSAANVNDAKQDPDKVADEVVNNLKSQGLFDQFRKECLEELEHLEAYRMLKQRVENHVASFLSKYKWTEKMSKNNLRDNLRMNINRSENLLNGIDRLVDQIIAAKSDSFSERIAPEIDKHLGISRTEELAPGTDLSSGDSISFAAMDTSSSNSCEINSPNTLQTTALIEPTCTLSASNFPQVTSKSSQQTQAQTVTKMNEKKGLDQVIKKQQYDNAQKCQRGPVVQTKGNIEPIQPELVTKIQSVQNQNKRESTIVQDNYNSAAKSKGGVESNAGNQQLEKENEGNKIKKDSEKSVLRTEKISKSQNSAHKDAKHENVAHIENRKVEGVHGSKGQASDEKELSIEVKPKSELQPSNKMDKLARMPGGKQATENVSSGAKLEDNVKEKSSTSAQKCDFSNSKTDDIVTELSVKDFERKDKKPNNLISTVDIGACSSGTLSQKREKHSEDIAVKRQPLVITGVTYVKNDLEVREDIVKELPEDPAVDLTNIYVDTKGNLQGGQKTGTEKAASSSRKVADNSELVTGNTVTLVNINKEVPDNTDALERGTDEVGEEVEKSRSSKVVKGENLGEDGKESAVVADYAIQQLPTTKRKLNDLQGKNFEGSSKSETLLLEVPYHTNDNCEMEVKDNDMMDEEPEKSITGTELSSSLDLNFGLGQRRVKRRKRLISEDEEQQNPKSVKVDDYEVHQSTEDSKLPLSNEDSKPKKGRGRPRKLGVAKSESQHSSDNELPVAEPSGHGPHRAEQGRIKCKNQEEPIDNRGLKRQRSVGSESNASDTCAEDRDMETNRRTRRQIKPKRCYSPSDGK